MVCPHVCPSQHPSVLLVFGVISLPPEKLPLLLPLAQAWAVSPLRFSSSEKSLSPSFLKGLSPPYRTRSGWWFFPAIQLCPFNVPPFSVGKSAIGLMIDLLNTGLPPPPLAVWSPKRVSLSQSFLFRIPSCPSAPSRVFPTGPPLRSRTSSVLQFAALSPF